MVQACRQASRASTAAMATERSSYLAFRERIVPLLRTYPLLRIWHCGCSFGEEVYTTAILLHEEGLYDRAQIYATDLSPRAVEMARAGVYPRDQLALFPEQPIRKGRDVAHVNAAADDAPALAHRLQRERHQCTGGREDDCRVEPLGRHLVRYAGPHRAQ